MTPLEEAARWANRAEENRTKAASYKDRQCQLTMLSLAEQAELWSQRAMTQAIAFDAALQISRGNGKEPEMLSRSGLHPYDEGLIFLLGDFKSRGPKSRAAVISGDVTIISERMPVRMLAKMFAKSAREVARDLIRLDRTLE